MKTINYIERPYIIYKGRICFKEPKRIEIYKDKIVYYFTMYDGTDLMLHEQDVYETEREAKLHL